MELSDRFAAVKIGDSLIYHDEYGHPHNALVTECWGQFSLNLLIVSSDVSKKDQYGRQTQHETSCVHKSHQSAHGRYWRFSDEEPTPYTSPTGK